jgi:hypothetical protein
VTNNNDKFVRNGSFRSSVFMVDSEPRDILPTLLTNPARLNKYMDALIGLMAHPTTSSQAVHNT